MLRFGNREISTNLAGQLIRRFFVPRHSFDVACERIAPEFMLFALPFEKAAVSAQMP
jgi:hypothetical protein